MDNNLMDDVPKRGDSRWEIKKRSILANNPWHEYRHDQGLTDHGQPYDYFYIYKEQSAGIVAIDEAGRLILVRQYRYLLGVDSLEIPGGSTKKAADIIGTAKQELKEETGYAAAAMRQIGSLAVASGHCTDRMAVFLATGCKRMSAPQPEGTELGIAVELFDIDEAYRLAESGELIDPLTIASLALARRHLINKNGSVKVGIV